MSHPFSVLPFLFASPVVDPASAFATLGTSFRLLKSLLREQHLLADIWSGVAGVVNEPPLLLFEILVQFRLNLSYFDPLLPVPRARGTRTGRKARETN